MIHRATTVILAIAPSSRGFGYTLFLAPKRLLDWGIKEVRTAKNVGCIEHAAVLIEHVRPNILIVEDWLHAGCRRSVRVKALLNDLASLAGTSGITVYTYSRRQVKESVAAAGKTKDAIATAVADSVPGLMPWLPRRRRIWESEQHSMAMLEAAALVLTHHARIKAGSASISNPEINLSDSKE
jgi:hypothetical protein